MNIFKKLFGKTKIDEVNRTDIIKPELIVLSKYKDDCGFYNITCLCVFDISYLNDFLEVISSNTLRMSIKIEDNKVYCYFIFMEIKSLLNNLSSTNPFFSIFKELINYFPDKIEYYNDGIIDKKDLDLSMIEEVNIYEIIQNDLNKMNNNIFTFRDLSILILIDGRNSIYDILTRDMYITSGVLFDELSNIYGDEVLRSLYVKKYNEDYKDVNIDNLISEVINEKELAITEDEDGNLIYDKNQFE